MRNHDDVTDEELKAAYDKTPAVNQYVPWAEVQANPTFKTLLKNQIIAHEQEEHAMQNPQQNNVVFLATEHRKEPPVFTGLNLGAGRVEKLITPAPEPKQIKRRSTITLHERQIEKLKSALVLSRNCLKYGGMSDAVRNEALDSIAESQKIIQSFYEPRG